MELLLLLLLLLLLSLPSRFSLAIWRRISRSRSDIPAHNGGVVVLVAVVLVVVLGFGRSGDDEYFWYTGNATLNVTIPSGAPPNMQQRSKRASDAAAAVVGTVCFFLMV